MGDKTFIKQWLAASAAGLLLASAAHAVPAAQGEGKPEDLLTAPDFVPMPLLNIPLLKNNRVAGRMSIEMVLDIASADGMRALSQNRTRLTAGYAQALSKWAAVFQDPRAPANVVAIKQQLQKVTDDVLGRTDAVVLLQSAMLRR